MAMIIKKSRSAIIVALAALLICSLSSAAWTFQQPRRVPTSDEDRKRALEQLTKQLEGAKSEAAAPEQKPQPAAGPAQPPTAAPVPAPAPVQPIATPLAQGVQLNFENQDLYDFINQITSTLGLTPIIVDPEVKGTVNLHSGPMSKEDILPLFSLILKNNNAALIQQDGTYQIVPISTAMKRGVDIIERLPSSSDTQDRKTPDTPGAKVSKSPISAVRPVSTSVPLPSKTALGPGLQGPKDSTVSKLATQIVRAEFVPVRDLIEPIKIFMTDGGVIMPFEKLNMLVLTDYTDNVTRIVQVIRMLDNSYLDPDLVELIKINNNASADVLDDLKKMFGSGAKDSPTGINFISLDRLNAIMVQASSKRALEEVKGWIRELDSSSSKNIQTYVYVVENSTASMIAGMLSALYGGEEFSNGSTQGNTEGGGPIGAVGGGNRNARNQGTFGSGAGFGGPGGGAFANQASYQGGSGAYGSPFGGGGGGGYNGGYGYSGAFGAGRQLGPQLSTNRTITSQVLRGGQFTGLQDTVRLVVDDVNNSLIIQSTPADYAYISETIRKMDILPRQALIDAKIYEVDLNDSFEFGINATLDAKTDGSKLTTGALTDGVLTAKTFIPVGDAREIMAALALASTKTKVKVLEAPSVLALDGQQAQIVVGDEVPYPGTSFTPSVGGTTTSVQYRDTGISLIVIPRISASGSVTMDIMQEVSAPGATYPIGDGSAQGFSKTSVQTTLSVKDGETVAIAGLIRDGNNVGKSGIPFLSDIPLMGSLFAKTKRQSHRNELIIMITPHVIRTPEKLHEMTQELRDSLRNVRPYAEEKEKQYMKDMEDAREDRYKRDQKSLNKVKPPKNETPSPKSELKKGDPEVLPTAVQPKTN